MDSTSQQATENTGGLEVVQVPATRHQHIAPSVTLHDLHPSTVSINEALSNTSQAQLMHTLTSFSQPEQLSASIGLQQGNATLSQTLPQSLTQTQTLDAFTVERVLMPPRNNLGQATIPLVSSVASLEVDGISVMRIQDGFTARPEHHSPPLVTSPKESSNPTTQVTTQLASSQISTSQSASHLEASQLNNMHIMSQDIVNSLSKKPTTNTTTTSTTSPLIASNRMLNKLLDAKPHIPSQVTKAAEIAHLVPNPSVRMSSGSRLGDMDDGTEMVFATTSRGSSPLTTSTRSSAASMCTVTGSLRGSSGYGDSLGKALTSLPLDGIFGLPSNFQLNSATLLLPNSISHGQIIPQRQLDSVLLSSQSSANMVEQQLEGLSAETLRVLPTTHMSPGTTCNVSGNNITTNNNTVGALSVDKSFRKMASSTNQIVSNTRSFNILGVPDGMNKSGVVMDSLTRSPSSLSTKPGLITSIDPMLPSVTSSCSSPNALGSTVLSRPGSVPQDGSNRVRYSTSDMSRISHQTLVDLLSRGPNPDAGVGGSGIPLIGLSESRLSHTGDVLLSELHRSDESDLSLGASLTGTTGEELHSNPSGLGTGIGGDTAPLQGLPSPLLPSFSLPNITGDFMVSGVSGGKSCSSGQGPLPALLSNLATTADLDQFLDNSNMCIDMSSLSESEVSLSTGSGAFTYSPEKTSGNSKKLVSITSSDLTFTSALKAATTKSDSEPIKLRSDSETSSRVLIQDQKLTTETTKALQVDVTRLNSIPCPSQNSPILLSHSPTLAQEAPVAPVKKSVPAQPKTSQCQSEKRKEMFRKNELLVQQVACFKCRLCSFLSQDKSEMVNHMKERHSKYLSDTDESEEEVEKSPAKRVKVLVPRNDKVHLEEAAASDEPESSVTTTMEGSQKHKADPEYKMEIYNPAPGKFKNRIVKVEEEQPTGRIGIFIKSEPKDVGEFERRVIDKEEEEEDLRLTIELGETAEPGSDHDYDDEDTNDSSITVDSGSTRPSNNKKPGRPLYSKTTGITKFKKKNPKVTLPDEVLGIRCDVNGCGLRMKSENNIVYHRKCHVNSMLQCQECSSTKFQSWRDLALHLWRQHLIDMELHKCDKCDYKSYSYSKLMNVHHKIHSDERPSLCDTCGKRFKTAKQLRNHKSLHMKKSEAPQHQCEICQRPFSDKRMLRNHQESVHKKVKPFLCNYCGYSTASRSTLKMHMRQHTGEKPFACEKCNYRTSDHNSLRRHKMQHTGVRPYRCPYCDYASIQSTTFKVHLKDKHPGEAQQDGIMFTCGMCSFKTVKRDNYLAHVAEHSRGESKKQRQAILSTKVGKIESPQTILSDMTPPAPHVVNIDVNSGTFTVESPHDTNFLNTVHVQTPVPGQVIMAGDQYIYAAVDSSVLSQVRSGESMVQLTQEMVGVPISIPLEASAASSLQGLVYVATTSQGGQ
ncbi:Zinc finger protein 664-like 2 [Homarus americanus]|uniref:Zinc finger protein 664-like 2 n=2 Tax=Homarus americanus TaxID=6706 RepID=A0A8J5JZX1_HOMAM|nr:Zinc finger protein 664-like 2 [Homarus americanus]